MLTLLLVLTCLIAAMSVNALKPLSVRYSRLRRYSTSTPTPTEPVLTQKEYLIAVRNRLFAIEEQIWLHEYAVNNLVAKAPIKNPEASSSSSSSAKESRLEPLSEKKFDQLVRARGELMEEYPLTQLYTDLLDAQKNNLTYAAIYLDRIINTLHRQLPVSMDHVNQIAVLSFGGQVINLMRGQGAVYHRLLPSNVLTDPGMKRQFQHPAFSPSGKYVSFAEMHFKGDSGFVRSDVLVFDVPKDPKTYGKTDSLPIFDSGPLPGTPFFLRFSPDEESVAMLCASPTSTNNSNSYNNAIVVMDWGKFYRKDSWAGQAAVARFAPRKALTLMSGSPVFFTYTTSSAKNATIVAHCQREDERAVWVLSKQDTGGVSDFTWNKISDSGREQRWNTPICHSAGGGDNVLVVEDNYLTTKAISRWKRGASKKIKQVTGQVQFLVSPDNSKVAILEEDINLGHYSLTVIEGEEVLDPMSSSLGISSSTQYELSSVKLTVAFWFSPDSTKLLCLTAAGKTKDDVVSEKGSFRVGLNSEMQWSVYNFPLRETREYDVFKPTPYFMKTYVPFFSQYAQVYNPWAPDSKSFLFMTNAGLSHTPLIADKYSLGMDKWQNQGATFGTWSRQ